MEQGNPGFSLVTTIKLPGSVGGHGDWVAYDPATHSVWLAQSPDNNVVVIDTKTNTVEATIPGVDNANGIALTPQYAFVADPTNNVVDVIDKHTFQIVGKVTPTGTTPDSVTYVPATGQVYVASDDANVLDALSATPNFGQTASYPLTPSNTGPDVATHAKGVIYIPDGTAVDAIDPKTGSILASPTLVSTGSVKPGVYDPRTDTFFFGTTNNQIEVVSGGSGPGGIGSVVGTIGIAGSTDEAAIDVNSRLAFFGDKAGEFDFVNLDSGSVVATLPAETGMHTLTVDPQTHELYVYENNRNVVDVWKYGNGNTLAQEISKWIHVGSSGKMGFADSAPGPLLGSGNTGDLQDWANVLKTAANNILGPSTAAALVQGPTGQGSGWVGASDWLGNGAASMLLPGFGHGS